MSCIAPVADATSIRLDLAATSSHTAPCSARASSPAATRACAAPVLHPPQRRVRGLRRRRERLAVAGAVPAAVLDAAHRHAHARPGADEDRHVERPVLLRAEDLLALVQEHVGVGRVEHDEVVHRRALVELLDEEAAREAVGEGDVLGDRRRAEQREDGERAVDVGRRRRAAARRGSRTAWAGSARSRAWGSFRFPRVAAGRPGLTGRAARRRGRPPPPEGRDCSARALRRARAGGYALASRVSVSAPSIRPKSRSAMSPKPPTSSRLRMMPPSHAATT